MPNFILREFAAIQASRHTYISKEKNNSISTKKKDRRSVKKLAIPSGKPVSIKHGLRTELKIRGYKTWTGKYGLSIKHGLGIKYGLRTAIR